MDLKILLIAIFATTTIYFAIKAHKYETMGIVIKEYVEKKYNIRITAEALRQFVKDELRKKFEE